jgi:hypothetical protein
MTALTISTYIGTGFAETSFIDSNNNPITYTELGYIKNKKHMSPDELYGHIIELQKYFHMKSHSDKYGGHIASSFDEYNDFDQADEKEYNNEEYTYKNDEKQSLDDILDEAI